MSFGAGIGGFVQGLSQGIKVGEDREDRRERRLDRQDLRLERQERREERARTRAREDRVAEIGQRAADDIAAGQDRDERYERLHAEIGDEYARQGRPDLARQFQEWRRGDEARRGTRHFQNAIGAFDQARRPDGSYDPRIMQIGLRELQRAEAIPSYGGNRNVRLRPILEGEGSNERFLGVRFEYRGDDGQTASRDIAADEIPRAAASFFNPQAAFEDRQRQVEQRRQQQETQRTEQRSDWQNAEKLAREGYEERRTAPTGTTGITPTMRPWADLTDEERDPHIQRYMQSRTPPAQRGVTGIGAGTGSTRPGRVAFDSITGQPVAPGARAPAAGSPSQAAAPSGAAEKPAIASLVPGSAAISTMSAWPSAVMGGVTGLTPPTQSPVAAEAARIDAARAEADSAVRRGAEPDVVARGLARAGIPQNAWPESVRAATQRRQQSMPASQAPSWLTGGLSGAGRAVGVLP